MTRHDSPRRTRWLRSLSRPLLYTGGWAVLLVWGQSASYWPCLVALVLLTTVVILVTASLFETARMRRRAWLGQYLHRGSLLRQWLRGGWLMRLRATLVALGLTAILLSQPLGLSVWHWVILLMNAWWLHIMQSVVQRRLQRHVKDTFLPPLTRLAIVPLNVAVLTVALVVVTVLAPQNDYRGIPFEAALYSAAMSADANCTLISVAERLALSHREGTYWLMQNAVGDYATGGFMALAAWTLMLLLGSAFAWAYTRWIVALSRLHPERNGIQP